MALALILRNTSKVQAASTLPQHFLKCGPAALTIREISWTPSQASNKQLLNLQLASPKLISQTRLMSQDHSKMWPMEKALSAGLLALVPATIALPNLVFDSLTALAFVIHFHLGLEACVMDYVRPIVVGNVLPKLAMGLLYLLSGLTLGGLMYYNVSDIGIGKTIRKFWAIKN